MSSRLLASIDTLAQWRGKLDRDVEALAGLLTDHGLLDAEGKAQVQALRRRLANDRLVVAFVAEFSRGKSELINALFFADSQRRVMPATPGRTTMCPVELAWDPELPAQLALLPLDTRIGGQPIAAWRERMDRWECVDLPMKDADALATVLERVTHTQRVSVERARELGLWHEEAPEDNPPRGEDGLVEVPAWRHALLNVPHPLLQRGLVVIDTPGLNAIGAEPELTLGMLPLAHAVVFLLGADTGVTKADLAVWRDHLGGQAQERFVVLNKIDALVDPLGTEDGVRAQIERQCASVAATLEVPRARVFPLSARGALAARVHHDAQALGDSRLPALEQALSAELLPRRGAVIGQMVAEGVALIEQAASRRLEERHRQTTEQLHELEQLRGKSLARLQMMGARLDAEAGEFERCAPRLAALRQVLSKECQAVLETLGAERVKEAVQRMRHASDGSLLRLGAAKAFVALTDELRGVLHQADRRMGDVSGMLAESQKQLNADFGLSLEAVSRPSLAHGMDELQRLQAGYARHVNVTQVWRLARPGFLDQFAKLLSSKLRTVFEGASNEIESWLRAASVQMDEQLREHRRGLTQRREAHARIRAAENGLEHSIEELQSQQAQWQSLKDRSAALLRAVHEHAGTPPDGSRPTLRPLPTPRVKAAPAAEAPRPSSARAHRRSGGADAPASGTSVDGARATPVDVVLEFEQALDLDLSLLGDPAG